MTAFGLAVKIGDWHRLDGRRIGAYLGLVHTESSSGGSRSQGGVTKTGNGHVRRLLVKAAWHPRQPYQTPGATMRKRWELASPAAAARGHAGNRRHHISGRLIVRRVKRLSPKFVPDGQGELFPNYRQHGVFTARP